MPAPRFIQVHFLTSYPGVLLNRDDAGLAKRLSYGGTARTRVSSQCLKRHWRTAKDEWGIGELGADLSVRTRQVFEFAIRPRIVAELSSTDTSVIDAAGLALSQALYGDKAKEVRSRQALLLGWREVDHLADLLIGIIREGGSADEVSKSVTALLKGKDAKANLSALKESAGSLAAGVEAALFGRMVTSDPAANTDAAVHVAHAFTVHEQESETDYFTVVDDLKAAEEDGDSGSAGIFDTELTSGVFYGYVVVDVPLLVANVTGIAPEHWADASTDRELAARIVEHLIHLIATVSPGAKRGSTAPYGFANTVLIEAGTRQPRSLASAFERAVRAHGPNAVSDAAEDAMFARLAAFDRAYGAKETRRHLSLRDTVRAESLGPTNLDELASWARALVLRAQE